MDDPPFCDVIGCPFFARAALIPGSNPLLTEYLCAHHWQSLRGTHPHLYVCYAPIEFRLPREEREPELTQAASAAASGEPPRLATQG